MVKRRPVPATIPRRDALPRATSGRSARGGTGPIGGAGGAAHGFQRGFTLLEILVVLVIIGLLASFVAPRFFGQIGKSEVQVAKAQLDSLEKALDQFRLDVGRYPTTEEGLNALVNKPESLSRWAGPYLKKAVPPDPWGRPYIYRAPGKTSEFDLLTHGKDGQPGGTGEAEDLSIH